MTKLRSPLGNQLRDTTPDDAALDRMWSGVQRRTAAPARRPVRWTLAIATAAATVLVVGHFVFQARDTSAAGPLRLADGSTIGVIEQPVGMPAKAIALSDGSQLSVEGGATLEPLDNSAERFDVLLRKGRIQFEVHPGGHRRWIIESGPATVEVIGTRFNVTRDANGVDVDVFHGIVLVRGQHVPGGVQRLTIGGHLHVPEMEASSLPPRVVAPAPDVPLVQAPPPVRSRPQPTHLVTAAPAPVATEPSWEALGRDHKYVEAYAALGQKGTAAVALDEMTIDAMLALADVARNSGHPDEAVRVLGQIPVRFPENRQTALASFTRGKVELDQLGHPANAAEAFAQAIQFGMPTALAEDAWVRLIEARKQAKDASGAASALKEYVERFPKGQDRVRLERLIGTP